MKQKDTLFRFFYLSIAIVLLIACEPTKQSNAYCLWYQQEAQNWNEALPLGNGRFGVMVFGNPATERIQLNDDSMWPGDKTTWKETEGNAEDLKQLRELLFKGENEKVDELLVEHFSRKSVVRSHQTLGDLTIGFNHQNITEYRRTLNIDNATATVSYKTNGQLFTQKLFVSHPHKAIVVELSSEAPEGLNCRLHLSRPEDKGEPTSTSFTTEDKLLVMQGEVTQREGVFNSEADPILHGVEFETCLQVNNKGGEVIKGDDFLELQNVQRATLYIVSNSSWYFEDYNKQNQIDLKAIVSKSFGSLQKEHVEDYKSLYSRMDIQLGHEKLDTLPTDQRIERVKSGAVDLELEALLFQYGRYLLISSSREGTNPANLQGLWNEHINAPWNGDYHLNINLQMNYWLANMTNLDELNQPLFDYVDRLVENGKVTAAKNFGCSGTFIPHATDLWAPTWLRAPTAYWGCSFGAGGWMMQHYWNHFEFTRDTTFLRERAFPAIEEVAKFYSDWIIEDPRDGTLVSAPSTSPENRFINERGNAVASCLGSAMDQQVIYEVFDHYLKACAILQINTAFSDKVLQQKLRLRPGFILGEDGRILEWDREYKEREPGHRHMSHLYGFHPGDDVTWDKHPELMKAVRKTLDYRLEHGGAGTGWSRAWLINCSARLLDGDMAQEHIRFLLTRSMANNLFDLHPPFQIDGNFGYTAGVAEMLLQSHEENILRILPALPSSWKEGYVRGLKARGGLTVDIFWMDNQLDRVVIKSEFNRQFNLIYGDSKVPVRMKKGDNFVYQPQA